MSSSTKTVAKLEEQLAEAGNELLQHLPSRDQLLPLLDQIESSLNKVEQSPATSTQEALSSLMKALVADELLGHPDIDVKVGVASCISEITRITAPDAPYDDDKMKVVFQLIVSSFEDLADKSSRSYKKRSMILETVAKVRSCVIMLDLECDDLINEMFQIFFKTIRDHHPDNIFSSMETIMSLVLEESEDISPELVTILLSKVKRDSEEVSPIAKRLGEKVLESCATKLKPYLLQAIKASKNTLDDYSKIVTSVCEESIGQNNDHVSREQLDNGNKPASTSSHETAQEDKAAQEASQEDGDPAATRSPGATMSNGISETRREGTPEKKEQLSCKPESHDLGADKLTISERNIVETVEEKGRKLNSSTKSAETSDLSCAEGEKEAGKVLDDRECHGKESDSSAGDNRPPKEGKHSKKAKDISKPERIPSPSKDIADEGLSEKGEPPKEKESFVQDETPSSEVMPKKTSDSDAKTKKRSGKPVGRETTNKDKSSAHSIISKNKDDIATDSEVKTPKHLGKRRDASDNDEAGSPMKSKEDVKRRRHGKTSIERQTKSSMKDDAKEVVSSPKSPTKFGKAGRNNEIRAKRTRTPGKEKVSETLVYGENLVGSRVKVYWPKDRLYYTGVIDFFFPDKKKHRVSYDDGDEETLNLKKERWEFLRDDSATDTEDEAQPASGYTSSEMLKKKGKRSVDSSLKPESSEVSPKRKLKSSASKSGKKSKDDDKTDFKSRDEPSKSGGVSEDEAVHKSKGHSQKLGGKTSSDAQKLSGKPRDIDTSTPKSKSKQESVKTSSKSKEGNQKTAGKSKGKTAMGGNKSNTNGAGKAKSTSSKVDDDVDPDEKLSDLTKTAEGTKRKLSDSSPKDQEGGESKSGKKRQRTVKG